MIAPTNYLLAMMVCFCNSCRVYFLFEVAPTIKIYWGEVRGLWCPFSSPNTIIKTAIQPISHIRQIMRHKPKRFSFTNEPQLWHEIVLLHSQVHLAGHCLFEKEKAQNMTPQSPHHTTTFWHECYLIGFIQSGFWRL